MAVSSEYMIRSTRQFKGSSGTKETTLISDGCEVRAHMTPNALMVQACVVVCDVDECLSIRSISGAKMGSTLSNPHQALDPWKRRRHPY